MQSFRLAGAFILGAFWRVFRVSFLETFHWISSLACRRRSFQDWRRARKEETVKWAKSVEEGG